MPGPVQHRRPSRRIRPKAVKLTRVSREEERAGPLPQPSLNRIGATVTDRMPPWPVLATERCQHVDKPPYPGRHVQIYEISVRVAADRYREDIHHRPQLGFPLLRARELAVSRLMRSQF
jgi:hypothetical protein